jgi:gliding motility-associated-like protein
MLLTGGLIIACPAAFAQLVVNNGALIAIKQGAQVIVKTGAVSNTAGTIDNAGTFIIEDYFRNNDTANGGGTTGFYRVQGDWENNATFVPDSSQVELYGANQLITGTEVTEFHHLNLTGTGIKTQTIDSRVNSLLALNDRELATDGNKMFVLNTDIAAITRTNGFVSSTGSGRLSREMASSSDYLFPVGSSVGVARYRPIHITASNSLNNTFEVRMANVDATSENFDRNTREQGICDINANYYHLIGRTQGTDPVQITKFFDPSETPWSMIAHWQNQPRWENTGTVTAGTSGGFNTLTLSGWNDFLLEPFAFAIPNPKINTLLSKLLEPTCFGLTDGSIDVALLDSLTPPYSFSWTPGGATTLDIENLGAGTYILDITDGNGCHSAQLDTFVLDQPLEIQLSASSVEVLCAGGNTGAINLTVNNAIPNVTYNWNNGEFNTEDISGLDAGDYTVVVTDFNDCEKSATFTVEEPTQLEASLTPQAISCFDVTDGELNVSAEGGTPNYSYLWNNSETTTGITGLSGGTYAVTITDNNGCTIVETATLSTPAELIVNAGPGDTIAIGYTAELTVDSTLGGTPEFSYTWYNTKDNAEVGTGNNVSVTPEENTTYLVVARDANGCLSNDTIYIRVDVNLYDFPDGFAPNGDNAVNQNFGIIASPVVELIEIKIFNRWGQLVFSGNGNGAKWDGRFNGELQPMDTYVYQAQVQLPDGSRENKLGNVILVW